MWSPQLRQVIVGRPTMEGLLPLRVLPSVAVQDVDQEVRHEGEALAPDLELRLAVVSASPDVVEDMHDEHHGGSIEKLVN